MTARLPCLLLCIGVTVLTPTGSGRAKDAPMQPASARGAIDPWCSAITYPERVNANAASDTGNDYYPQVTTDGAGNWVAVWYSYDDLDETIGDDSDILFARSTDNGATWTAPAALNNNAASDSGGDGYPQVTTDGAGNWVAVWHSQDDLDGTIGDDWDILFARSTDNGATWTAPFALNTNAALDSGDDASPQATTDGAGNWVALWSSHDDLDGTIGDDSDILFARSTDDGGTWTAPTALNSNAANDSGGDGGAQVTTDKAGNWVAVWTSGDDLDGTIGDDGDILFARSTDNGATWTAPAALNSNAANHSGGDYYPQVSTNETGNWVAVWDSGDTLGGTIGSDKDILSARSTDNGATWTVAVPLNTNAPSDSSYDWYPQVTTDEAGNWVALWSSHDDLGGTIEDDSDILFAHSKDDGITWTAPLPLNGNAAFDTGNDWFPQLTADWLGHWVAVWYSDDDFSGTIGTDHDILVVRFVLPDCNGNGVLDDQDIAAGTSADDNDNGIPDECEIDTDGDGVGDLCDNCELYNPDQRDCQYNGVGDVCDISDGISEDCNGSGTADDCDLTGGVSADCNSNGIIDECDIDDGASEDCNENNTLDECDIADGTSEDCNANTIPDECEPVDDKDDDGDGVTNFCDNCELFNPYQADCQPNGIGDVCDIAGGDSQDVNGNGVPDECDECFTDDDCGEPYPRCVNSYCVGSARMFLMPTGVDPYDSIPGMPYQISALPGEELTFDVWVENTSPDRVASYSVWMPCHASGGDAGAVEFTWAFCNKGRPEYIYPYVLDSCYEYNGNCPSDDPYTDGPHIGGGTLAGTPPVVTDPKYLSTWRFTVAADAAGVFTLSPVCYYTDPSPGCPWTLTFLGDPGAEVIPFTVDPLEIVVPAAGIVSSEPPGGAIDARQPTDVDGSNLYGWSEVVLTFDADVTGLTPDDFTVTVDPPATPPFLAFVHTEGSTATLQFGDFAPDPIPPGHWTIITHNASDTSRRFGYLPGDVNADRTSSPRDILALIDALNGVGEARPIWSIDMNRSGAVNSADILRLIDLLNGGAETEGWNGRTLPD